MKVESVQLQLASSHALQQRDSVQTTFVRAAAGSAGAPAGAAASTGNAAGVNAGATAGANAAVSLTVASVPSTVVNLSAQGVAFENSDPEQGLKSDKRYLLVKALFESLGLAFDDSSISTVDLKSAPAAPAAGTILTRTHIQSEAEQTGFVAKGQVTTSDGQKIDFNLQVNLQRSHSEQSTATISVGPKVKDPLVLNLDGNSAQLTDVKFSFDLNADGQAENISFVTGGSAFLALDKNADGKINNGSELFGPGTNDGFAELAAYDSDHNQVIDENDAVFSQLRLYNKDANGQDQLATLAEKGVGAILLAHADTPFAIKDGQNNLQGQLRASGVYLRENGGIGSVQQVDLRV